MKRIAEKILWGMLLVVSVILWLFTVYLMFGE
jgi:hypothetical protein